MMELAIRRLVLHLKPTQYCHQVREKFRLRTIGAEYANIALDTYRRQQLNKIIARAYQKI